jgi:hypothetical protein
VVALVMVASLVADLQRVAAGHGTIADRVDPAAEPYIDDRRETRAICVDDYPYVVDAIDRSLVGTTPRCRRDGQFTICAYHVTGLGASKGTNAALAFMLQGGRWKLYLAYLGWEARYVGNWWLGYWGWHLDASCQGRGNPVATASPTRRWMRRLVDGDLAWETVIDPDVGFRYVTIDGTAEASALRCGDDAVAELRDRYETFLDAFEHGDVHCNRQRCTLGSTRIYFRTNDAGDVVVASVIDVGPRAPYDLAVREAWQVGPRRHDACVGA